MSTSIFWRLVWLVTGAVVLSNLVSLALVLIIVQVRSPPTAPESSGTLSVTTPIFRPQPPSTTRIIEQRLSPISLTGSAVAILIGCALAVVFARRIAQPFELVSRATKRMRGGDLASRVEIGPKMAYGGAEALALAHDFNAMAETLEENTAERKRLIAEIAHELRTPLTILQSRLQALEDGMFPLNGEEVLRLQGHVGHLSRLVEDLRTLSLADTGRLQLQRRYFDLLELVREVIAGFQVPAERLNKQLNVRLPQEVVEVELLADRDRLRQILVNLIDNALRYAEQSVHIQVSVQAQVVVIDIDDDGVGLPAELLDRVFDRFFKVDAFERDGSGLGLAIARALAEAHGGSVSASRLERVTRFEVWLPRCTHEHEARSPE